MVPIISILIEFCQLRAYSFDVHILQPIGLQRLWYSTLGVLQNLEEAPFSGFIQG